MNNEYKKCTKLFKIILTSIIMNQEERRIYNQNYRVIHGRRIESYLGAKTACENCGRKVRYQNITPHKKTAYCKSHSQSKARSEIKDYLLQAFSKITSGIQALLQSQQEITLLKTPEQIKKYQDDLLDTFEKLKICKRDIS